MGVSLDLPFLPTDLSLSLVFVLTTLGDLLALRLIPTRKRALRFVCRSAFFTVQTVLIVALIGSPFRPVFKVKDLPHEFWLQVLACSWWALAARGLIGMLALTAVLEKAPKENKMLSDIIAACVYVCSGLAIMGFVFGLPLQGIVATSGVLAIVLGLALQNTLGDVFSGLSLSVEKPFDVGDAILLEGGVEGAVIQINWRSTHLRNSQNDVVIVPHSSMAKMRIQNHTALSTRYNGSLIVAVDSRNEPEFVTEILTGAVMTCPAILENPLPSVTTIALENDRVTYEISFSTSSIASAGEARSQIFRQLYKRARPGPHLSRARPLYFFGEEDYIDRLAVLEPLSAEEKAKLRAKIVRRHFKEGEELLVQGSQLETVQFVSFGVIQGARQVADGRVLKSARLGPGDFFGEVSLLTGMAAGSTLTAITPGVLLGFCSEDLKPILASRPELVESVSHAVARKQHLFTVLDHAAIQETPIEQHHLLSRIRSFFNLHA
jgi:small-conductance mechanosensitive channel/CRP-like cAMP-binding protein